MRPVAAVTLHECRAKLQEPVRELKAVVYFLLARNKGGTAKEWPFVL